MNETFKDMLHELKNFQKEMTEDIKEIKRSIRDVKYVFSVICVCIVFMALKM